MMRSILVSLMIALVGGSPVNAAQATVQGRMRMAVVIADYIRDVGKSNEFKTKSVDLGATVIEGQWALADWRSDDRKLRGQVAFVYRCDSWNVEKVKIGHPFRAQDLTEHFFGCIKVATADKLIADLKLLENQHIAYLDPAHSEVSC